MDDREFQIFNTMTKQKEAFKPKIPGKVGMYVCGVTAYDLSHIGHARAYVAFDVLYRYLQHLGYEVNYIRNFTDVDDKIIRRANELGEDPIHLSGRFCDEFHHDMASLQCLPPTSEPRVSDHMSQIIDMITQIINNGFAYVVDEDVFFSIDKSPCYGCLSGRKLEDNRAGERVNVDSRKRNPADFALWKICKLYHPLALRIFLMGTHYRSPVNYSSALLEIASERIFYIYQTLLDCEVVLAPYRKGNLKEKITPDAQKCIARFHLDFRTSMADDLHTPVVLASLLEPLKTINTVLNSLKGKKQKQPLQIQSLVALEKEVKNVLTVLGLMSSSTCSEVLEQLKDAALKRACLTEDEVLQQIEERALARKNKEYAKSDEIRKKLSDIGIALMDVPEGTIWRPCVPPEQQQPVCNSNDETETRLDDKTKAQLDDETKT
eukprot:TRINITY_DN1908_c0_g1_i1.p1 TRINITY_DN1908_c0_g1~~TRINITY_DN1908_c0_g1_i1.p1  ORF type:complete len:435 (-),score=81.38 TRINITY_DN1908_c0_g1_i1:420-1724(-)